LVTINPATVAVLREVKAGQQMVFTQVSHLPHWVRIGKNNPGTKVETKYDLESTVDASSILVLRDNIEATVLRLEFTVG
jgi:hypothetical protein